VDFPEAGWPRVHPHSRSGLYLLAVPTINLPTAEVRKVRLGMKLITSCSALRKHLMQFLAEYSNVEFAVAWASANTDVFNKLVSSKAKIKRAVIGTHFYQTHPDVLDRFVGSEVVKFIRQPSGVFHPKIYLFSNHKAWDALVGSANLTGGALGGNTEVMLHISHADAGIPKLDADLRSTIAEYWEAGEAKPMTLEDARSYRAVWERMQPALRRLSGQYGRGKSQKAPIDSTVMSMRWDQYVPSLKQKESVAHLKERLDLLNRARIGFHEHEHFSLMELGLRQTIAGTPTTYDKHWGWFGSMKGAGYFKQAVNNNNEHLSLALDCIPLDGPVTRAQYDKYITEYILAFEHGRHGVATASRLLALKRPEYFVCLDSKNSKRLCDNFGIGSSRIDYERYWEEIIERITDSPWWNSPRPKDPFEARMWAGRAAMLDSLFYKE
jgi:HKD family nuclease